MKDNKAYVTYTDKSTSRRFAVLCENKEKAELIRRDLMGDKNYGNVRMNRSGKLPKGVTRLTAAVKLP